MALAQMLIQAGRRSGEQRVGLNLEMKASSTRSSLTLSRGNLAPNLFDLYTPGSTVFQIDANFGYPAAVLRYLQIGTPGSIRGARIRGGITLDFVWSGGMLNSAVFTVDDNIAGREREVVVNYAGQVIGRFRTGGGVVVNLS
ncbi:hypothetical protein J3R82DRAFT_1808 [Butyriboletus roseoflavus]|nr:hypothetical protein J3R82DRAFT_1808 [Butyriboletus roseoflavus]